jgi:hypothetical protein
VRNWQIAAGIAVIAVVLAFRISASQRSVRDRRGHRLGAIGILTSLGKVRVPPRAQI